MGWIFRLVLGILLLALGAFVALRPLFTHGAMLTNARWLDVAFAVAFLVRGAFNVRSALRRRVGMSR
jgi:hypothetical protein